MTSSSSESIAPVEQNLGVSSFSLWPLPDLGTRPTTAWNHGTTGTLSEEEIYDRGYADGVRTARVEAEQGRIALLDEIRLALADAATGREEEQQIVAENTYAIALVVARQIVHRAIEDDDGVLREMVVRAIDAAGPSGKLEIRMHPADLERVAADIEAISEDGEPRKVNWEADPAATRGSCAVETPGRLVDGGVDAALANLYARLCDE